MTDNTDTPVDRHAEIERLAGLNVIDYETARVKAAERLRMRTKVLDEQVEKTRRALGQDEDADDRQGRVVKIEDTLPWHEPVDGDHLLTALVAAVRTYAVLPDHAAVAIALWILHTWMVNSFTISPRLAVTSPTKGCGKTTILRILNDLAHPEQGDPASQARGQHLTPGTFPSRGTVSADDTLG